MNSWVRQASYEHLTQVMHSQNMFSWIKWINVFLFDQLSEITFFARSADGKRPVYKEVYQLDNDGPVLSQDSDDQHTSWKRKKHLSTCRTLARAKT